jgi:predicted outer membrane repeat protein
LDVKASTFSGNTASSAGGAIGNFGGTATVTNSTFSGNSAAGPWGGGAIYSRAATNGATAGSDALPGGDNAGDLSLPEGTAGPSAATLVVTASTFSGNTSLGGGGAIGNGGSGETGGTPTIQNTVLGGNLVGSASVNCYNFVGTLTDAGYNLEDADTCPFSGTSLKLTDPMLLGLGNYGGSTLTIALRATSPAIDRIPLGANGCGTTLITDQRGVTRPQGAACDMGAFEYKFWVYLPLIIRGH